ncbi:hypothetical protein PIB30_042006 [Stylosanthes scabra]|uniref:Ubiquitin-like protease family profile domain-containing protein n=1 Tax=Stylosanthes scabra TaxID=79078 RepID=A0ABU6RF63_9FABA|nr:hypothetical protein [Stylosanthes scabra]
MDELVSGHGPPLETPQPTQVIKDDLEERVAIWATMSKGHNDFENDFEISIYVNGTKVVSLMCHVLNAEEDERFEKLVYCAPPEILQRMFGTHHHNWMGKKKKKPHDISSLKNHEEYSVYLDIEKLFSHRFEMFVLDSKNISSPKDERTALNKFASNILNQMLKWVGAPSILKKGSQSLLPKYINIPQQPNDFDCAVFVMKWMELINPIILAGCCTYNIEQWTEPMLEEFRKKLVVKIIMSKENSLRADAIKGAQNTQVMRPSAALRSPYVQMSTPDLPTK